MIEPIPTIGLCAISALWGLYIGQYFGFRYGLKRAAEIERQLLKDCLGKANGEVS